jgi:transcription termination/antitermination protein NusG
MEESELRVGQIVKVINGPFTGFRGEVKAIDEETLVARVAVQVYGRTTSVDLKRGQVKAVPSG